MQHQFLTTLPMSGKNGHQKIMSLCNGYAGPIKQALRQFKYIIHFLGPRKANNCWTTLKASLYNHVEFWYALPYFPSTPMKLCLCAYFRMARNLWPNLVQTWSWYADSLEFQAWACFIFFDSLLLAANFKCGTIGGKIWGEMKEGRRKRGEKEGSGRGWPQ